MTVPYDSRVDTLTHSLRVGELMMEMIKELLDRSVQHDLSKTREPEREAFDRMSPLLPKLTYGTPEYFASLDELGPALQHHYAANRHHPEHFPTGINGMTLMDLIEMLADWVAAGERHTDHPGSIGESLRKNQTRFSMSDQLIDVLHNTASDLGWIPPLDRTGTEADASV